VLDVPSKIKVSPEYARASFRIDLIFRLESSAGELGRSFPANLNISYNVSQVWSIIECCVNACLGLILFGLVEEHVLYKKLVLT